MEAFWDWKGSGGCPKNWVAFPTVAIFLAPVCTKVLQAMQKITKNAKSKLELKKLF
jgi:hypothetical protein